jgi:hypothetical protein
MAATRQDRRTRGDHSIAAGKVTAGKESQSSAHGDEAAVLGDVRHIDVYNRSFESGVLASLRGCFPEYDSALWDSAEAKE